MKGQEWSDLAMRLRDDEKFRRDIIEEFKQRGMSDSEAEARVDRAASVAEAAALPPSQRTDQQKADIADAEADPTFKQDMQYIAKRNGVHPDGPEHVDANKPKAVEMASVQPSTVSGPGF
jgi:hypothetical protein